MRDQFRLRKAKGSASDNFWHTLRVGLLATVVMVGLIHVVFM